MLRADDAVLRAKANKTVIPAFNIPYLPMVRPVVQAVVDMNTVAMVQVARVEWEKLSSGSLEAVAEEYHKYADEAHTLLHLDHIPVVDEDLKRVDYLPLIQRAIGAGYQSVMIDGSRLPLEENIAVTREVSELAHAHGIPCEAELGSVMGHESGPRIPYEEIFQKKLGFTDVEEARKFAAESGCDWLSIACGSIHGAIADNFRSAKKPQARLDIAHIERICQATGKPLVLHGGSGIPQTYIQAGIQAGIAKINVGTEIRQPYEAAMKADIAGAQRAVYEKMCQLIESLGIKNNKTKLYGD